MSVKLNEVQNATVGMTVGVIEVLCLQPFNYAKNMVQQGLPLSANPVKLYRGVFPNAVNMGSCTTIQFVVGGALKKLVTGEDKIRRLTISEQMMCGIGAGAVSSLAGSPLELIMIQQQRKGGTLIATAKSIANPNLFFRGLTGMAVRESLWTCGYLSIPPMVRQYLRETYPEKFDSDSKARVPAALLGGLFACYLTQPFDTIKTCMQGDIERTTYGTFSQTGKVIFNQSSVFGFYRGATFRYGRMVCAVFMMDTLQSWVGPIFYPEAFK